MVEVINAANAPQDNRADEAEETSAEHKQTTYVRPDGTVALQSSSAPPGANTAAATTTSSATAAPAIDSLSSTQAELAGAKGPSVLATSEDKSAPNLPDVSGNAAPIKQVQIALDGYVPPSYEGISGADIYNILQRAANAQQEVAATIRRGAQSNVVAAKQLSVSLLQSQIGHEQNSNALKFGVSIFASLATAGAAFGGSAMKASTKEGANPSLGSAIEASAQQLGSLINEGSNLYSKLSGPEYKADMDRIAGKVADISAQIAQNLVETAKSGWDAASENLRNVQSLLNNYMQNWTQVTNNTANR